MAEFKSERTSEWVARWGDNEWNSKEYRDFIIRCVQDGEEAQCNLNKIEPLYEEQERYIKYLERQLDLLQKTLDIAERYSRPIILPGSGEVMK